MEKTWPQSLSTLVRIQPEEIALTPEQVARYAGGSKYRADDRAAEAISATIERAQRLIVPAVVQAVHPVAGFLSDGSLRLENGYSIKPPSYERDPSVRYLAAVICTIGPALEKACQQLVEVQDLVGALYLDAAGVAALEALSERAYELLSESADSEGLSAGCRFGPGNAGVAMSCQEVLFRLVDGELIGVSLNESMVMQPGKSISFFVALAEGRNNSGKKKYKCQVCQAADCSFRLA